ncbi:hypothetical protein L9F63_010220, partial [Diploptera punctata]
LEENFFNKLNKNIKEKVTRQNKKIENLKSKAKKSKENTSKTRKTSGNNADKGKLKNAQIEPTDRLVSFD